MKNNHHISILSFLAEHPTYFYPIGWNNLGVSNWNNIPWYDSWLNIHNHLSIPEKELTWIIEYLIIKQLIERWKSNLCIKITKAWIDFLEETRKSYFQKIWEKYSKEIIVGWITFVVTVAAAFIIYIFGIK
jgi:hypothetical protein